MFTRRTAVAFMLFAFSGCYAVFADEGFDFFVEACRHSGYNPGEIATFQATIKESVWTTLPESTLEEWVEQYAGARERTLNDLKAAGLTRENAEQKMATEYKMESVEAYQRRFSGVDATITSVKVFMKNSVAVLGLDDVPVQVKKEFLDNKEFALLTGNTLLFPPDTHPPKEKPVRAFQSERDTMITRSGAGGDARYHLAGRIRTSETVSALNSLLSRDDSGNYSISDMGIAQYRENCIANERVFTLSKERTKYEGNYSAYILDIYEGKQLREQVWIDPDRGYICPRAISFNPLSGSIMSETISEDFVFDKHSQKWFPRRSIHFFWNSRTVITEFRVEPESLILNQPIPDSLFALTIPKGMRIDDVRRDDNDKTTFIANQTGELDLQTIEQKSLDDIEWLTPREVAQPYEPYVIKKAGWSWLQIVLMSLSVIMILLGLARLIFKKREDTA